MPEDLDYAQLEPQSGSADPASVGQDADLRRLRDVPVDLAVEIGRARMTVGDTLALRPGSIVKLDRLAEEPLDLLVNGTRIARGEVVVIDEDFGLRITEVVAGGGVVAGQSSALAVPAGDGDANAQGDGEGDPDAEVVDAVPADVDSEAAAA
jgi:flagellar motor switch protein FliN/FliY